MPSVTYRRERRRLAGWLRQLRQEAGFSGNALAKQLDWVQSKVSKIETAKQLPTEDDIRQWAGAVNAQAKTIAELVALLERARAEYVTFKEQFRAAGGGSAFQADILALEAQDTRIRKFQPGMVIGLLQTAEYARELMHLPSGPATLDTDEDEIARMVAVRMQRQQVLYDPRKQIQVVLLEAALHTRICSPATLYGQLDRLLAVLGLPSLELGIVPFTALVPLCPLSGFAIHDQDLVVIETVTGETQISDPEEIARYERIFELLREAASYGEQAAALIRKAMQSLHLDS